MRVEELQAYELIEKRSIAELASTGYYLKHKKTGARVCLLSNEDKNKVFYIGFRTPAPDDTGVPHIMEHSVLCGSREFPVKDPFVELAKGSLNTFLNAMTYPDKTVYPVASCNDKDFQNLIHVYMDAVFYPNIYEKEEIFRQEGWHYEMDSEDGELTLNGVVYNEMKGAFSSPESVLERVILSSLYPDTTYANESGGDPEAIPELSYSEFLDFHSRYYHPSNSYIFLYGDCDMAEKLSWLDENYLSKYDYLPIDSEVRTQAPFEKMAEVTRDYSISAEESEEDNTYLSWNKSVGDTLDEKLYLGMQVLEYVLLSMPGAPLKQALLDAGIGRDIMSSYDNGVKQPIFSIIAKNANESQKAAFVETIEATLARLVSEGLDEKAIRAGINYFEFRYREADFGNYPAGLMYGLQAFDSWLYKEDSAFLHLEALDTFAFLKEQAANGYFEGLIVKYLLENPHGSLVVIRPKRGLTAEQDEALKKKLAAYKESLTAEERKRIVDFTKHLKEYQSEPSPQEDLEKIPLLERGDIGKEALPFQNEELPAGGIKMVFHDLFTNGIGYVNLIFRANEIPEDLIPYLGLLKAVLGKVDTENYSYGEFAKELNLHTGGIYCSVGSYDQVRNPDEYTAVFEVHSKALYEEQQTAFSMMREMLMTSKMDDPKRLREIVAETKSRLQMAFQTSGHSMAALRAMSYFSESACFSDMTGGVDFYHFIEKLDAEFEERQAEAAEKLSRLAQDLFRPENLIVSCTAEKKSLELLVEQTEKLAAELYRDEADPAAAWSFRPERKNEGLKTSAKIQYVARSGSFVKAGLPYTGALRVLRTIMSYDYLWNNIRVKGGAYGCMNNYARSGNSYLVSYRDPNLEKTNEIFEKSVDYTESFEVSERDMTKYIIGTVSSMDTPLTPSAKGARSMSAWMTGLSFQDVQKERDEVLSCGCPQIRALAPYLKAILSQNCLCVIGNEEKLEEQKDMFGRLESLFH
ncbi:peptidase M16 [Lachnoclostridium sp. An131]|uniref:insulinase family protein n=1 Tax=Lachnoclostridium sp. An131 TaxID=1965555 RepID=UPI000B38EA11|nr:insulinase family protein [Lachnoclostridium sp. An131]OUQ27782.1 peptidase M16 [Lachnoclostridium sp. An131]